jgi:hypothetical protein
MSHTLKPFYRAALTALTLCTLALGATAGDKHDHKHDHKGHKHAAVEKGPNGGQLVDAGAYHIELVVNGKELVAYVSDLKDTKLPTMGATASADVISKGTKSLVELAPAGDNTLKGTGNFAADKSMKVLVRLRMPGKGTVQGKFEPLSDALKAAKAHTH